MEMHERFEEMLGVAKDFGSSLVFGVCGNNLKMCTKIRLNEYKLNWSENKITLVANPSELSQELTISFEYKSMEGKENGNSFEFQQNDGGIIFIGDAAADLF